jgi:methylmalonyl-CoA mutase
MTGPSEDRLALASAEDRHSAAEWEKLTAAVLRKSGRMTDEDPDSTVWEKLARTTLDGISVAPIGTPDSLDGLVTAGRPSRDGAWDIRALVEGPDAKAANDAVLADLANGVTSVWVQLGAGLGADDLAATLQGVDLGIAPVVLDARGDTAAVEALAALLPAKVHPATNLGADPIGSHFRDGLADPIGRLAPVATTAREKGVLAAVVDATVVHDLGASDGQELAYAMAVGAAYLRELAEAGFGVEEAAGLIEFRLAATDEQFPTIAKLRAARRLWARVLELSGASEEARGMRVHAVTSRPMLGKYDPYVNMLRTTVAAFAAGVGGAESVTVLPFDSTLGHPDAFGRRIARNTSHLLIDESHVAKVVDPAGGSYAVERLTDDLAKVAWAEFGTIESDGGILGGFPALRDRIAQVVETREKQIALRKRPLTGISEFPNLGETLPERQPSPSADAVRRYGASFEALRDEPAAEPVFLATMGPIAHHTARATFATNLLAAGGVAVEVAGATDGPDALVSAYQGQKVVCLAGTDKAYAEWGAAAVEALRAAGATYVVLAGKPGGSTIAEDLVDDSAAMGLDALAFLTRIRAQIEGALA